MNKVRAVLSEIKKGNIKPVYFLMGEEPWFIDQISQYLEKNLLPDTQKAFNQLVVYGKEVKALQIISRCRAFPMMPGRQLIVIREAGDLGKELDKFLPYFKNPVPHTTLVFCYKNKKLARNITLYKALKKYASIFESKKLYENQAISWTIEQITGNNYGIDFKTAALLVSYLGTDLNKINNELQKLYLALEPGSQITGKLVEVHIGVSRQFNNFELRKAVGEGDTAKAAHIIQYFAQNPRNNPLVVTVSMLFNFFNQLFQYHNLKDRSKGNVARALGINPYFVSEYQRAALNFPLKKVSRVISLIRAMDVKSKGVGAQNLSQADILTEWLAQTMELKT